MNKKKDRFRIAYFIVPGLVIAFLSFPYLHKGLATYSDAPFHLYRIYSIANEMQNGIFLSKIHYLQCYGYGYGSGFFYQDTLLYLPGLLVACGMPLDTAYKVFAVTLFAAIGASTYYSAW